jgi:hypothetical protein
MRSAIVSSAGAANGANARNQAATPAQPHRNALPIIHLPGLESGHSSAGQVLLEPTRFLAGKMWKIHTMTIAGAVPHR